MTRPKTREQTGGSSDRTQAAGLPAYAQRVLTTRITHRWWLHAACATRRRHLRTRPEHLMRLCADCPVRKSCLATALLVDADGTWAGTTPAQRRDARTQMVDGEAPGRVFAQLLTTPTTEAERRRGEGGDQR